MMSQEADACSAVILSAEPASLLRQDPRMLPCNNQGSSLGTHNIIHFFRSQPRERAGVPYVGMQALTDLILLLST